MAAKILIGTASWSDPEFIRDWYPHGLPAGERLAFYAMRFGMVELNSSFYSIPSLRMVEQWKDATPHGFIFNVKLHKLLSRHACELKMLPTDLRPLAKTTEKGRVILTPHLEEAIAGRMIDSLQPIETAGKLGLLLLQLSPAFSPHAHRLEELDSLLSQLSPRAVAVELRNRNWVESQLLDQTIAYFKKHQVTLVSVDAPQSSHFNVMPSLDLEAASAIAYLRLHGRNEHAYLTGKTVAARFDYDYSAQELEEVRARVKRLAKKAQTVHVVFNNNRSDYAPDAALRFRQLLGQSAAIAMEKPGSGAGSTQKTFEF
ncbi:MAG: hypothetical protein JWL59_5041 [Chthoniobacteraceae bacterium]|nr:hypothetical protein [Chthoniobacteraceae bacterium]